MNLRVLLVHEHGRSWGCGAVTAMFRLHEALLKAGVESTIACRKNRMDREDIFELPRADSAEDLLSKITWRLGLNDLHCVSSFKIRRFKPFLDADVVNFHGCHSNFFNYLALPGLSAKRPVVLTMHDMWHITGHCSQSYECERWKTGCGRCPHMDTFPPVSRDSTAVEWRLKKWAYRGDVTFVAPSQWLVDACDQSMIAGHDVRRIGNPIDTRVYRPLDKAHCRRQLGLPTNKHVIMFASVAVESWAKGGDLLVQSLRSLPPHIKRDAVLLVLGANGDALSQACDLPVFAQGYVHDDAAKAIMYGAADVLVQPSRAETQSLVVLEAMACGVPVVGSAVRGVDEMLQNGRGLLAPPEQSGALSEAITQVFDDPALAASLSRAGRAWVDDEHRVELHAQRYIDLFMEKVEQRRRTNTARRAKAACL